MQLLADSWAVANVWLGGQGHEKYFWKISAKDIWKRLLSIDLSTWSKRLKILVSHVNISKGWHQQRRILTVKWII